MSNGNTLVAVFGYQGDAHQIWSQIRIHESHKCPIVIMSPENSRITRMGPHICRWAGKRAYIGQESLDRQVAQMRILLDYPQEYFLLHDSDSVCLSPLLPRYLYESPGIVWANIVSDEMHPRDPGYPYPRIAMQPPYFLNRAALHRFVEVGPSVRANPRTPFIDWFWTAVCHTSQLNYRNFPDGASCGTHDAHGLKVMSDLVKFSGRIFIHSIKTREALARLVQDRREFRRSHKL